jgi:toxin ParE1/3/4
LAFKVEPSDDVAHDLEVIFDFLYRAALELGDDPGRAFQRAATRVEAIEDAMEALGQAPFQGTLRPDLLDGLRNVTKDRAIFYFDLDQDAEVICVLAVLFGGQDHQRRMLLRLMENRRI